MRQLMISLDRQILDPESRAARRMVEYGKKDELFILIPASEKKKISLSDTVKVWATGGGKLREYFRLKRMGLELLKKYGIKFITVQDPFFLGKVGCWLKKKTGAALEVQVHGDFFGGYYKKQWLRLHLAKFILKHATTVRTVGERVRRSLLRLGVAENKILVRSIQNDLELIKNFPSEINLHNEYPGYEKIFLVLGRLEPVKNVIWLIAVFKEVLKRKNCLLLIVGKGSEEARIRREIVNFDNNIKLQDWTEDPYGYLKTADGVLFPSLSESYGLVPVEANIVGTPIIMNDVGVANYELKPSDKVKILPINDKEKWIQAILSI